MRKDEAIKVYKSMIAAGRELDKFQDGCEHLFGRYPDTLDKIQDELLRGIFEVIKMVKFDDIYPSQKDIDWFDRTRIDQHREDYKTLIYERSLSEEEENEIIRININFLIKDDNWRI